jgi:hypothetical protein
VFLHYLQDEKWDMFVQEVGTLPPPINIRIILKPDYAQPDYVPTTCSPWPPMSSPAVSHSPLSRQVAGWDNLNFPRMRIWPSLAAVTYVSCANLLCCWFIPRGTDGMQEIFGGRKVAVKSCLIYEFRTVLITKYIHHCNKVRKAGFIQHCSSL